MDVRTPKVDTAAAMNTEHPTAHLPPLRGKNFVW
jgi:hypothetical protein